MSIVSLERGVLLQRGVIGGGLFSARSMSQGKRPTRLRMITNYVLKLTFGELLPSLVSNKNAPVYWRYLHYIGTINMKSKFLEGNARHNF